MAFSLRATARWAALALLIAAGVIAFGPPIAGLTMLLVTALFIPAMLAVLGWFIFSVWGKIYFRAWRIRRIRSGRYLKEAAERGRHGN